MCPGARSHEAVPVLEFSLHASIALGAEFVQIVTALLGAMTFVNVLEQVPGVQGGVFVYRMTPVVRICKHCTCDRSPHFLLKKNFHNVSWGVMWV